MKKTLSLLLALCLALGLFPAYADTTIEAGSESQTAQTAVVLDLGVQPTSYTIIIPSQVNIDPETGKGSGTITLKSGFVLSDITSLSVRLTGGYTEYQYIPGQYGGASSERDSYLTLKNSENTSSIICFIGKNGSYNIEKTDNLIHVTNKTDNSTDQTCTLSFSVNKSSIPSYGLYTGTLTFSVITQ